MKANREHEQKKKKSNARLCLSTLAKYKRSGAYYCLEDKEEKNDQI